MTVQRLIGALLRHWPVALVGAILTSVASCAVLLTEGAYWSQTDVVFLAPLSARNPNVLQSTSDSLISTAGIVERIVNRGADSPAASSASVTLIGEGVLNGYAVRLPDDGGQWAHNFNRQVLDVQVSGPTEDAVRGRLAGIVEEIDTTLAAIESERNVATENRISIQVVSPEPSVRYFPGGGKRSIAMVLALGLSSTLAAIVLVDGLGSEPRWSCLSMFRTMRSGVEQLV